MCTDHDRALRARRHPARQEELDHDDCDVHHHTGVVAFHPDDDRAHRMHSAMTMPVNEVAQMPVDRMMPWMPVWWMVGGLLVTVLVVALLIAGLYAVIRAGQRGSGSAASSQAMAILEERYARGEIDHEEFEERRRRLGG